LDRQALAFGYRSSAITSNMVVTRVALALRPGNQEEIRRQMIDFRAQREAAQPRGARSFGSAFKNPPGMSAGRMLDDTGCKELIVGGAAVSAAHANFIINRGNATTADVVELMNRCRRRVFDRYGVRLDPEVRFLGDIGLEEL
jgi:UDP-N-acetylenolpyruvoylglucosamine reductase